MNLNDYETLAKLANWLVLGVLAFVTFMRKPGQDAAEAVKKLEAQMTNEVLAIAARLDVVEERMTHMPRNEDVARLTGEIQTLQVRVEGVQSGMEGMGHQLNRIENYLLNTK